MQRSIKGQGLPAYWQPHVHLSLNDQPVVVIWINNYYKILLKQASNKHELTNWENILQAKHERSLYTFEILLADYYLFNKFILNPVEDSTSGPIKITIATVSFRLKGIHF